MKLHRMTLLLLFLAGAAPAFAAPSPSPFTTSQLDALSFHQHPGASLPLDAPLIDEAGETVRLGAYFKARPVILVLDYLHCKSLCGFVLSGLARTLGKVPLVAGKDFEVLAISIDPHDTPADSRAARAKYLARSNGAGGWHFLTGSDAAVHRIAAAVGFPYLYNASAGQYAHPAGITIVAPNGTVARYILGLDYRPLDLRLALTEAARGAISTPAADLLLLCYCYDPATGRYSAQITFAMRLLGGATVLGLGAMILRLSGVRLRRG
ncbi:MAG TPA: SCO family protein [Stellaceae bacterium]|jgi:protein SCO1/2|nr:SCO family protein [Stellaceae bacterium]